MPETTVHVISHTHWDREWYFTDDDSQVFMAMAFEEMLDKLESVESIRCYMLDAQTSVLEEFLRLKPDQYNRVNTLIESGKLITGPWYSQPDVFNVQGESIIRNLLIGIRQAESFGGCMHVGYLPDTFGFNAQMPLIYHGVGINRAIVRRGYDPKIVPSTEFRWTALDGRTSVLTAVQPFGYSMAHPKRGGRMRNFSRNQLFKETYPLLEKVKELSGSQNVMLTVGGDQVTIDDEIDKFVEELSANDPMENDNFIQSDLETYFGALEAEGIEFPEFIGELRMPRFARVHRTIGSVRYDIKQANYEAEMNLLRVAEPISVLAASLGFYADTANVERAWKLILESHAHDSMGCCNSDDTNATVLKRCRDAWNTADGVFYLLARLIGQNIDHSGHESAFIIVNGGLCEKTDSSVHKVVSSTPAFVVTDVNGDVVPHVVLSQIARPYERKVEINVNGESESVDSRFYFESEILIGEAPVPALGYSTFFIDPVAGDPRYFTSVDDNFDSIENEHVCIEVRDGHVCLKDKHTGNRYDDVMWIEDCANDGDLYDFSPLADDDARRLPIADSVDVVECGAFKKMVIHAHATIPYALNSQRSAREGIVELPIETTFILGDSETVDVNVRIENTALDHRMRLVFNCGLNTTVTRAGVPFGSIERAVELVPANWRDEYGEMPVGVEPMEGFVSMIDDETAFSVFAEGCKEYEVLAPGIFAVTLFACCGQLGKCDLQYRPGRESGRPAATPDSQLQCALDFHFGISVGFADGAIARIAAQSETFKSQFALYQDQPFNRSFQRMDYFDVHVPHLAAPRTYSIVKELPQGASFASMTLVGENVHLRIFNGTDEPIPVDPMKISGREGARFVNCLGDAEEVVQGAMQPNSFVTIAFPVR